jgi:hypothetical protein
VRLSDAPATKHRRFRASLHTHKPLTSIFGRRLLRLWGQFVGTYSALAYAAGDVRGGADAGGPYAAGSWPRRGRVKRLHRLAQGMRMQLP